MFCKWRVWWEIWENHLWSLWNLWLPANWPRKLMVFFPLKVRTDYRAYPSIWRLVKPFCAGKRNSRKLFKKQKLVSMGSYNSNLSCFFSKSMVFNPGRRWCVRPPWAFQCCPRCTTWTVDPRYPSIHSRSSRSVSRPARSTKHLGLQPTCTWDVPGNHMAVCQNQ